MTGKADSDVDIFWEYGPMGIACAPGDMPRAVVEMEVSRQKNDDWIAPEQISRGETCRRYPKCKHWAIVERSFAEEMNREAGVDFLPVSRSFA